MCFLKSIFAPLFFLFVIFNVHFSVSIELLPLGLFQFKIPFIHAIEKKKKNAVQQDLENFAVTCNTRL